ncbi:MAG: type II toxin-antitoxin system HicB family antitoxin [Candidatus Acidiferrales bacterium]
MSYNFKIKFDREEDGRWIAEVPSLPGVLVYGPTKAEAARAARSLALRVLADRVESADPAPASQDLHVLIVSSR